QERERTEDEHVDVVLEPVPPRLDRPRDEERDRGDPAEGHGTEDRGDHAVASSSPRRSTSASIASSFIFSSISCGLKRARANRPVRRRTDAALALTNSRIRVRYSTGASDSRRGMPRDARASSIFAYASITALRGFRSRRRSSSVSLSTSESATLIGSLSTSS